jgi:hypothetical protein
MHKLHIVTGSFGSQAAGRGATFFACYTALNGNYRFQGNPMLEFLVMLLKTVPSLALFIGYLYAADSLDSVVRTRYPVEWNKIAGHWDAHSSSNAFLLVRESKLLRSLDDAQVSGLLTRIQYLFWAFALSLVIAYFIA